MSYSKRSISAIIMLFLFLAWSFLAFSNRSQQPAKSVSTLSTGVLGLDLFQGYLNALKLRTNLTKRAFFETPKSDVLFIAGPRQEVTEREAVVIESYLKRGGILYLSFHDQDTKTASSVLFKKFFGLEVAEDKKHVDGVTQKLNLEKPLGLLGPGAYEFYSPFYIEDANCRLNSVACYYREKALGNGKIILQLGLPLFSNGLIAKSQNRNLGAELASMGTRFLFDEYHHFARERTLSDLLTDWKVAVPLYGMILMALLYFFFGNLRADSVDQIKDKPEKVPSYLELQDRLVRGLVLKVEKKDLEWHEHQLLRLFPGNEGVKSGSGEVMERATRLLAAHFNLLRKRGGDS